MAPHPHQSPIGIGGGNHLGTTIMTILPHLCHQDSGASAIELGKFVGEGADCIYFIHVHILIAIYIIDQFY